MDHVQTIILGQDEEKQISSMKSIIKLGFPDGVIAICWQCNRVDTFTVDEAARHITNGSWPRCCDGQRMSMEEPGSEPPF